MKCVLTYRAVDDFLDLAMQNYPAHSARVDEFHGRGVLLMVGTMAEPMNGDAMAVFTSREAADEFVAGDPFVLNGVVAEHSVRAWDEVLVPPLLGRAVPRAARRGHPQRASSRRPGAGSGAAASPRPAGPWSDGARPSAYGRGRAAGGSPAQAARSRSSTPARVTGRGFA